MKTFEEFQNEVLGWVDNRKPKEWRRGQAVFNYIDSKYNVARDVQFLDEVDCFYNDNVIDQFILLSWKRLCGGL